MTTNDRTAIIMACAFGMAACADLRTLQPADQFVDQDPVDNTRTTISVPQRRPVPLTREDILAGLQAGNVPLSLGALMVTGTR